MKVERQDIVMRHERDVIVLTGPDGSRITLTWNAQIKGFEIALQVAAGDSMCPYLTVFPVATNTVVLTPREGRSGV